MEVYSVRRLAEEIDPAVGIKHAPVGLDKRLEMLKALGGFFSLEWIY